MPRMSFSGFVWVRFALSDEKMIKMHKEFRSYNNVVQTLLVKNARNVVRRNRPQRTRSDSALGCTRQHTPAIPWIPGIVKRPSSFSNRD